VTGPALTPAIAPVLAQVLPGERPLDLLVLLGAMAMAPLLLVTLTSFLKVVVVLSVLRSALGVPQVPPNAAVTGLALLVTLLVMQPVATACLARWQESPAPRGPEETLATAARAAEPLRAFLARFADPSDRRAFALLAARARGSPPPEGGEDGFGVLAPAFAVSELRRAFTIGFLVFLPFLVVDLAVASVLLSLGLTQLSPTSVAVPFKLLLLVAVDGFGLVTRGLAAGYLP
jgi:type III secretion protein R